MRNIHLRIFHLLFQKDKIRVSFRVLVLELRLGLVSELAFEFGLDLRQN